MQGKTGRPQLGECLAIMTGNWLSQPRNGCVCFLVCCVSPSRYLLGFKPFRSFIHIQCSKHFNVIMWLYRSLMERMQLAALQALRCARPAIHSRTSGCSLWKILVLLLRTFQHGLPRISSIFKMYQHVGPMYGCQMSQPGHWGWRLNCWDKYESRALGIYLFRFI